MLVTLSGIFILVKLLNENALEPMLVTGTLLYTDGIIISVSVHSPIPVTSYDSPLSVYVNP